MKTQMEWVEECKYISSVTEKRGIVRSMNNNTATFIRYCEMQRDAAKREGRFDTEEYIQSCIDDLQGASA